MPPAMPITSPRASCWERSAAPACGRRKGAAEVGERVGEEGADEHVDQQGPAVLRQLPQQHGVREGDCDPADPQRRERERRGEAGAIVASRRGKEHRREGRRADDDDLELGPVVGGDHQGDGHAEGDDLEGSRVAAHAEQLLQPDAGERRHDGGEEKASDCDRGDDRGDPGQGPAEPRERLRAPSGSTRLARLCRRRVVARARLAKRREVDVEVDPLALGRRPAGREVHRARRYLPP